MKNISSVSFNKPFFLVFISLLFFNRVSSQENGIYELNENNQYSKTISKKANKSSNREPFYELSNKLHATAYLQNNEVKKINGNDKDLKRIKFYDTKSFNLLNQNEFKYEHVELITIMIKSASDLNNTLDLNAINGLTNLKYIFIKCYFKCTENQIREFIKLNSNVRVFYKVENHS